MLLICTAHHTDVPFGGFMNTCASTEKLNIFISIYRDYLRDVHHVVAVDCTFPYYVLCYIYPSF